ncbi:MAG: chromosomal replication initiator protein DnaA [Anaerolineaceae bacterium]|nr:chromosomal replication initiator protein DnaA [Anaerolineaceae bacterium]
MNANQAWQSTLGQLQMEMSKASFETWVQNAEMVSHEDKVFTIGVKNAYARDWLEGRLTQTVQRILTGLMGHSQNVEFVVWQREYQDHQKKQNELQETISETRKETTPLESNVTINRKYTFDTFVVGASNRLAHAASLAVADSPARAYNPLFLYGGVGLGKTHLLQSIGNAAHRKGLRVLYVSSEEFTNDFIYAIQKHTNAAFRERYRQTDVLLIDDIQFIANKEQTQEEFFHTFNTLHGQDKQIVISSDRPPKALETLEERLRSRFEWGLIGDIQPPDLETRIAILKSKAERSGRQVPGDILELIARQIQSNIRELEGALTRVIAFSDFSGKALDVNLANTALADLLPKRASVGPDQIVNAVSDVFGISKEKMIGRGRTREVVLPRQVAMYLLRKEANVSLPQIGNKLGGRDHSTVMHACDKIKDMIERDNRLRRQVIKVREQLYGNAQAPI